jgi:hypothetical protein
MAYLHSDKEQFREATILLHGNCLERMFHMGEQSLR